MNLSELITYLRELRTVYGECWVEDARGILIDRSDVGARHNPKDRGGFGLVTIVELRAGGVTDEV